MVVSSVPGGERASSAIVDDSSIGEFEIGIPLMLTSTDGTGGQTGRLRGADGFGFNGSAAAKNLLVNEPVAMGNLGSARKRLASEPTMTDSH